MSRRLEISNRPQGGESFANLDDAFIEAEKRDRELARLRRASYKNRTAVVRIDSSDNLLPDKEDDELQSSPFEGNSSQGIADPMLNFSHIVFFDDALPGEINGQVSVVSVSEIGDVQSSILDLEDHAEQKSGKIAVDQKRVDQIIEGHLDELENENIVFDPDPTSQMRNYLNSGRFSRLKMLLPSEHLSSDLSRDMRTRIAGCMFEDMAYCAVAGILEKTNLQLLSPEGAFDIWRYLYPYAEVLDYPLGKKSLAGIPVPDGLVVSKGLEGYKILSTVEYTLSLYDGIYGKAQSFKETSELYPGVFLDDSVITAVVPKNNKRLLSEVWMKNFISVQELPHFTAKEFGIFARNVMDNQLRSDLMR